MRIFFLLVWPWPCKVANSLGPTRIYCSIYPSIRQYCPIAPVGSATRWIYGSDSNFTQQWCVSYARDIFWPDIQRQGTHSWDGLERLHLGQSDEITSPSPLSCMAKFYASTTTRHDVGSCYCHPVPPQTFRTIPKSVLQVPPAPQCQLPYWSSMETYTKEISEFG